ncbi:MAG: sigma-70 family RNA polymerase sigma factor [Bryobacteraceae bacterium]|nr:sigma-70 family RNA polymerase sigma factor [Bryobacteraceae bacterium]
MSRDEILSRLRERIVAFAASRIRKDVADDLAQEVLIVLETKYSEVATLDELMPLSLQILRFKLASFRRKTHRRGEDTATPVDDLHLHDLGPTPESFAEREELLRQLTKAIGQLGGRCREIFRLKLLGRTFEEIREELGANTINTVYTWDSRCRQSLLALMGGRWDRK